MNLEDQVCSVELANRLRELNVNQESIFFWIKNSNPNAAYFLSMDEGFSKTYHKEDMLSAFTVSELGEILPNRIIVDTISPFNAFRLRVEKSFVVEDNALKIVYLSNYRCDSTECVGEDAWLERTLLKHNIYDSNFANCFAKLLIKLIEDEIIKI